MVHDATGGRRTPARPEADKEKDSAQRAEEDKPKKKAKARRGKGSPTQDIEHRLEGKFVNLVDVLPPIPKKGMFDVKAIKDSQYFFS